ncbi:MAG TPA: sensor histidine kinase [Pseudorhodoplanes sp.]|nr:sensor histidine kinase [Pseudorhodoplanes sp.]
MFPSKTPELPVLSARRRRGSLRVRLAILVAGACLPFILFAGGLVYFNYWSEREEAFSRALDTVRSSRSVLDAKMQGLVVALEILANSRALRNNDLDTFRDSVDHFLEKFPGASIALGERDGTHLFNSGAPAGRQLPRRTDLETIENVFRTGQPSFSNLFVGSVSGRRLITISVPVRREGKVVADLSFSVPLQFFQELIARQAPSEWTVSLVDRKGTIFARVPNPENWIGEAASPSFLSLILDTPEGTRSTVSLEGVSLLTAWTRSSLTGWILIAGTPVSTLTAPLWTTLAITLVIAVAFLSIALAFAIGMAARIAHGETLLTLMVNELNHRVKNTLATIQSIASQTFRNGGDPIEQTRKFEQRLHALGNAYNLLSDERWANANLRDIVHDALAPFAMVDAERVISSGPDVRLAPRAALMMSLVLHELSTNATKYGALSVAGGQVRVDWELSGKDGSGVRLTWRECGGPQIQPPERKGFGTRLIQQGFAAQTGGQAKLEFDLSGLVCTLECPRVPSQTV